MNQKLQAPRGTQDLMAETSLAFRKLNEIAFNIAFNYGYDEIATPIFEFSDIFHRTLGETSDIVSKETYTFLDRGGDSLTLRPEGTAGIARAFISNGLAQNLPLKLYYYGPMFRYERPQKGRYRQFHQIGVECLGLDSPIADVESLALGADFLSAIGLMGKVQLKINSLGDPESRRNHRDRLVAYLTPFEKELSADSQIRLHKNPLRILDSKDANDQKILENAPALKGCLNDHSKKFFDQVLNGLESLNIKYFVDDSLVRGIDYYTHTVFEYVTTELGAQGAVLAGGRYDGLIEQMGGPQTCGIGWASGVERLALLINQDLLKKQNNLIAVISADATTDGVCLQAAHLLRKMNFAVEMPLGGNMGKKFKKASKSGAVHAVVVGESELKEKYYTVKNMQSGEQTNVPFANLENYFKGLKS